MGQLRANASSDVVVFGGGIAGLTVVHECAEAGLNVRLFERDQRCGGKAVGYRLDAGHPFAGWPVEHSLRTYHCQYPALFETMKRIPFGDGRRTVFDNVRGVPGLVLARLQPSGARAVEAL